MATKKPLTATQRAERRIARIEEAWSSCWGIEDYSDGTNSSRITAEDTYAEMRAAVYAVVPGRQRAKNIDALLDLATAAVCRSIRATHRKRLA